MTRATVGPYLRATQPRGANHGNGRRANGARTGQADGKRTRYSTTRHARDSSRLACPCPVRCPSAANSAMPLSAAQKTAINEIVGALTGATSRRTKRRLAGMFLELVDKDSWPEYYEVPNSCDAISYPAHSLSRPHRSSHSRAASTVSRRISPRTSTRTRSTRSRTSTSSSSTRSTTTRRAAR